MSESNTIASGRFISLVSKGGWEYATRSNSNGIVAMMATTDQNELVLVEQYRPPIGGNVIEIPAGLVGDDPSIHNENPMIAAKRELLEETGYCANELVSMGTLVSSSGLTDESVEFFRASNVELESEGGGVEGEKITTHLVPINDLYDWLNQRMKDNVRIDTKVYSGIALLQAYE